jgi:hypothetical protein
VIFGFWLQAVCCYRLHWRRTLVRLNSMQQKTVRFANRFYFDE